MDTNLTVHTSYQMGGHDTLYGQDPGFYHSLPNYQETYAEEKHDPFGRRTTVETAVARPDIYSLLSITGSAVLSSTVLATAIKTWLRGRKTKITITATRTKTQVTYEGPNLKASASEIQAVLEGMLRAKNQNVNLLAERMDAQKITAAEWRQAHEYR